MIIQLDGRVADDVDAARQDLTELVAGWGHELAEAAPTEAEHGDKKAIDPVAVTALIVSLPSAALAVYDLADRIRKRRRAAEMIDHARQLTTRGVTVYVMNGQAPVALDTLDPDRLLDLAADKPPA